MDIQKLIYFDYAARYLNFTKAAEACHITQVAMSRSIAQLERELGAPLFNRTSRSVALTPAGQYFYGEACIIIDRYLGAISNIKRAGDGILGSLSIGYGGFDKAPAVAYAESFRKKHPGITFSMLRLDYRTMANALSTALCDVVFGPENRLAEISGARLATTYESEYECAVSSRHALAGRGSVDVSMTESEVLLYPEEDNHTRSASYREHYVSADSGMKRRVYANCTESLLTMVSLNIGISFVPDLVRLDLPRGVTLLPLDPPLDKKRVHSAAALAQSGKSLTESFLGHVDENRARVSALLSAMIDEARREKRGG